VDIDTNKIAALKRGEIPIYEPGLEDIVHDAIAGKRLEFTTDPQTAVDFAELQFIAVGTPPDEDGSADLQYVLSVAKTIGEHMQSRKVVVDKSTVPVGTADKVAERIRKELLARQLDMPFDVVSNPEFLKEGAAIEDFMKPDRIIVGTESEYAAKVMRQLYAPFSRNHDKLIVMDTRSAELTKYAANAMLATKISFMNEIAQLAERLGADVEKVRIGIGADPRIGYHFIYPGCGYGGSCFPKDVKALEYTARSIGFDPLVLSAVEARNEAQKQVMFEKLHGYFGGNLKGKVIALWGLAFKPNTDDMREASSRVLMEKLWDVGAKVQAFDPEAMQECRRIYGQRDDLLFCDSPEAALQSADALAICTEWKIFRSPDFDVIGQSLKSPLIVDGRNLYDPENPRKHGLTYLSIGRNNSNL
jgi:UDPglucose 6-dehydrogenase